LVLKHTEQFNEGDQANRLFSKTTHPLTKWRINRVDVELATVESGLAVNHYRLPEPLGYIPPAEDQGNDTSN